MLVGACEREPSPPQVHRVRYSDEGAGSMFGPTYRVADVDLDQGSVDTSEHQGSGPSTKHHFQLDRDRSVELRGLAATACAAPPQQPDNACTDFSMELFVQDNSCTFQVKARCPFMASASDPTSRLVDAVFRVVGWR
jgi:hypothetical protein